MKSRAFYVALPRAFAPAVRAIFTRKIQIFTHKFSPLSIYLLIVGRQQLLRSQETEFAREKHRHLLGSRSADRVYYPTRRRADADGERGMCVETATRF